jgi:uncharacterized protein YkwD
MGDTRTASQVLGRAAVGTIFAPGKGKLNRGKGPVMLCKSLGTGVVATLLLAPLASYGQQIHENNSESGAPAGKATASDRSPDLAQAAKLILSGTNKFRAQKGRPELSMDAKLSQAAQYFADFMARTDKYGHTADGKEPWERAAKYGYEYCIVAENIAWEYNSAGFTTEGLADAFVEAWKNSPPHRKNMLDADLSEIGVGVAYSPSSGKYYAVQDFGRPKSKEIVFQITNLTDSTVAYDVDGKSFSVGPHYTITHRRCRPPRLEFQWADSQEAASQARGEFHPQNHSHYVVRRDQAGKYIVAKE